MGLCSFARSSSALRAICLTDLTSAGLRRPFGDALPFRAVRNSPVRLPRMSIFLSLSRCSKPPPSLGRRTAKISPTDRLTQATREEFDDPDFNPVPSRRRLRAKQG